MKRRSRLTTLFVSAATFVHSPASRGSRHEARAGTAGSELPSRVRINSNNALIRRGCSHLFVGGENIAALCKFNGARVLSGRSGGNSMLQIDSCDFKSLAEVTNVPGHPDSRALGVARAQG